MNLKIIISMSMTKTKSEIQREDYPITRSSSQFSKNNVL